MCEYLYLSEDAGEILGIGAPWIDVQGTYQENHGFDLLFGSVYQTNIGKSAIGKASNPGNRGLAMKGGDHLLTAHEVLHTFDCDHVYMFGPWIMGTWPFGWPGWAMHGNTDWTL